MIRKIDIIDEVLRAHEADLGADFEAYRNHAYRVANFCAWMAGRDVIALKKIGIASAFHDLGIWTHRTFDYLTPSAELAAAYLTSSGRADWVPEISGMILAHHKITPFRASPGSLIDCFRRADWVDVSRGLIRFGVPGNCVREVLAAWPNAGFHRRLLGLSVQRARTHPWSPLPMMRL